MLGVSPEARVEAVLGDITTQDVDVIVNAANATLLGGIGIDGSIHAAAGPTLLAECAEIRRRDHPRGLPVGHVVATGAGDLPARWVLHTVGPNRYFGETDPALLASCISSSLTEAVRLGAHSIAFPAISAGIFGWAADDVAHVTVTTTWRAPELAQLELVRFVLYSPAVHDAFLAVVGS